MHKISEAAAYFLVSDELSPAYESLWTYDFVSPGVSDTAFGLSLACGALSSSPSTACGSQTGPVLQEACCGPSHVHCIWCDEPIRNGLYMEHGSNMGRKCCMQHLHWTRPAHWIWGWLGSSSQTGSVCQIQHEKPVWYMWGWGWRWSWHCCIACSVLGQSRACAVCGAPTTPYTLDPGSVQPVQSTSVQCTPWTGSTCHAMCSVCPRSALGPPTGPGPAPSACSGENEASMHTTSSTRSWSRACAACSACSGPAVYAVSDSGAGLGAIEDGWVWYLWVTL